MELIRGEEFFQYILERKKTSETATNSEGRQQRNQQDCHGEINTEVKKEACFDTVPSDLKRTEQAVT